MMPRLIPNSECKQSRCACPTTGCWDKCSLEIKSYFTGEVLVAKPGHKLMPKEPTQAMVAAMRQAGMDWENSGDPWDMMTWFRIYKAAYNAAP